MPSNSSLGTGLTVQQTSPGDSRFFIPPQSVTASMLSPAIISALTGYDAIVGPAITNLVGYTSLQTAINAFPSGGRILVLAGSYTENITISASPYYIVGQGYATRVTGNFSISGKNTLQYLRITGNLTMTADYSFVRAWCSGSVTDSFTNDLIVFTD